MKEATRYLFLALVIVFQSVAQCEERATGDEVDTTFAAMTFNIRYDNPKDRNPWNDRKGEVAEVIAIADLIGLQEALSHQIEDLEERLPEFAWFGVGRDDGESKGEFACVFYRKERFKLIEEDTFWLSQMPDKIGSKSWDAAITRIATWGLFKDLKNNETFYLINTHFDHKGENARVKSAELVVRRIAEIAGESPVVVMGDLNCDEHSEPYRVLNDTLSDARYLSGKPTIGPRVTMTHWDRLRDQPSPIDYIFVSRHFTVSEVEHVTTMYRGLYPSDHLPVKVLAKVAN